MVDPESFGIDDDNKLIAGWHSYKPHLTVALPQGAADQLRKIDKVWENAMAMARVRAMIRRFEPIFRWYDFYVGAYYDRTNRELYVFPIPMLGLRIRLGTRSDWRLW